MSTNPFDLLAKQYTNYRPTYPQNLFQSLAQLCIRRDAALDCGCGNGQATTALAKFFKKVIGSDASKEQIELAAQAPNVEYLVSPAEQLALPDQSIDLLTVSNAVHWFDLNAFYKEVSRVLKHDGIVAVWCYGRFETSSGFTQAADKIVYDPLEGKWAAALDFVWQGYTNLPFPFEEIEFPKCEIRFDLNLEELLGYISSWSAVGGLRVNERQQYLQQAKESLKSIWPTRQDRYEFIIPLSIRVGQLRIRKCSEMAPK